MYSGLCCRRCYCFEQVIIWYTDYIWRAFLREGSSCFNRLPRYPCSTHLYLSFFSSITLSIVTVSYIILYKFSINCHIIANFVTYLWRSIYTVTTKQDIHKSLCINQYQNHIKHLLSYIINGMWRNYFNHTTLYY